MELINQWPADIPCFSPMDELARFWKNGYFSVAASDVCNLVTRHEKGSRGVSAAFPFAL
ncbi:hypothetical protein [uncultured Sphingomonas sp.]|uniref:hypothetical protein n=1 Tax=uncultured Sphingomonas sp. TaxID=158754 RepID=UPI0025EA5C74|nr:hypothetical protein [uncultured Sphingomonas sp.]